MEKTSMPQNFSYTLLVHAGSYQDFLKKISNNYPDLNIVSVKKRATHYYVILVTENGKTSYKKEDIYKLPIMGLREEFSNYIFFKSIKAYNNVLKFMFDGKNNKEAPYELFNEMLTGFEKYKYGDISDDTKKIEYVIDQETKEPTYVTTYSNNIWSVTTLSKLFLTNKLKVDDVEVDLLDILKKQDLKIGILSC